MNTKTKTKWTPGPWELNPCEDDNGHECLAITSDNRPGYVAGIHCADGVVLSLNGTDLANARLIAAAPELAEFVQRVGQRRPEGYSSAAALQVWAASIQSEARAILARLNGGQSV